MIKTVGEIAAENPSSVRVFERYGIDYCCGGKVSLAEACRSRGIEPMGLEVELEQAATAKPAHERDWTTTSLASLIDHIVNTHHAYLNSELPRLQFLLDKVQAAHGARHGDSLVPLGGAFEGLRAESEAHLGKEEVVLFPIIKAMETARQAGRPAPAAHCGSVNNPIRVMVHEHDNAGRALEAMRASTGDYTLPADACNTYRALFTGLQEMETDLESSKFVA
jgi:regulator of cell morphogenesis and NO signaling